jgi:hypothetical protein
MAVSTVRFAHSPCMVEYSQGHITYIGDIRFTHGASAAGRRSHLTNDN